MRDDNFNWCPKWVGELPSPEELMPLSQTLITPDLAVAFNIYGPCAPPLPNSSAELDSTELSDIAGSDDPARALKRPRLVWTPQLHKRFVDAVAHLGIKNAVPKTIMQLMSVEGLTRENVASHLQKYRLYLKRIQSIDSDGGDGNLEVSVMDSATDRLFASSPVPAHFLHPGFASSDHFLPFVPPPSLPHHHYQAATVSPHHRPQPFRHFRGLPPNLQIKQPFLRQSQQQLQRMETYAEDLESANEKKVISVSYWT